MLQFPDPEEEKSIQEESDQEESDSLDIPTSLNEELSDKLEEDPNKGIGCGG